MKDRLPRYLLMVVAVLLLTLTVARIARSWANDSHIEHVSAVWVAMALDLSHGTFYRAPFGPQGYGGTRFFPLYFVLHALFIKLLHGWRVGGYFLSAMSIVLLLTGVFYLLRRLGADRWIACACTLAVLAGASAQDSLLTIREDGMASMLNIWGVALCTTDQFSGRRLWAAATLFALAFATKETSLFGIAAIFLWLLLRRNVAAAWRLLALTGAECLVVVAVMYFASEGRAFEALRVALSAGMSFRSLLQSPATLVQTLNGYVAETVLLVLAVTALLLHFTGSAGRRFHSFSMSLTSLLFLCTLAVTLIIFSSEGTAGNHLLDLHVASVVLFGAWASEASLPQWGVAAPAIASLLAWFSLLPQHKQVDFVPLRKELQEIVRAIGSTSKPILSENPLVPITAGQQPYLLDPFMFRVMREKNPAVAESMWRMLAAKQFAAVVLMDDPDSDYGQDVYSHYHFGEGFVEQMRKYYEMADAPGEQYLFLPRADLGRP
ncbi:MAG TPA: hypothetical protein VFJ47_03825 [Terriglobales bacterium]|nr:hypothetical protein [Terriglobales bacterium]